MQELVHTLFHDGVEHYQAGRLLESERLCRSILRLESRHADSFHLLGLIASQRGHFDMAIELIGQAIQLSGNNPGYHSNLGNILKLQGRTDEAEARHRHALRLKPDYPEAHNNLGVILSEKGRLEDAMRHYECALALRPEFPNALSNLGAALAARGRPDDAMAHFRRALAIDPDHAETHNNLGKILYDRKEIDDAIMHFERALAVRPGSPDVRCNLGLALAAKGRVDDAVDQFTRVIAISPNHAEAHNRLGNIFYDRGRLDAATEHYERAILGNPDHPEAHNNLGNVLKEKGELDEALAHYDRAIAIRPDYAEVHLNRSDIRTFERGGADLEALETLAASENLPEAKKIFVHFALAKALEDTGDHSRVFEHMRLGNTLKRRQVAYDEAGHTARLERIAAVFDKSLFARFHGQGDPSSVPVFVLGMPRSGSTLIEQILASHPQIHGAGELMSLEVAAASVLSRGNHEANYPACIPALNDADLRQIARCYLAGLPPLTEGRVRVTDKMPGNFMNIGLIRLILPNARIIHTMRNPIDTCVSCYSKLFTSGQHFTYDLAELGRYYRRYSETMAHWRCVLPADAILDVAYEDVVDNLECQARRLIDYCGLPWDDRCINFHATGRPVKTASAVQIRKPLFRSSLQRWRKFDAFIDPLLRELGDLVQTDPRTHITDTPSTFRRAAAA